MDRTFVDRPLCLAVLAALIAAASCMEKSVITVTGKAGNAKSGAAVVSDRGVYYVNGLDEWPEKLVGRKVKVTGRLEMVHHPKQDPALPSTAIEGDQMVICDAFWKPADE